MKLKGIKISREAKILFGLMCLAAAVLIWVNLATQRFPLFGGQQSVEVTPANSSTPVTPVADGATADASALVADAPDGTSVDATAPDTTTPDATALDAGTPDATVATTDAGLIDVPSLDGSTPAANVAPDGTTPVDIAAVSPDGSVVLPDSSVSSDSVAVTTPGAVTPTVAVTPEVAPSVTAAPIAARDVQLAELPFLVTEAPVAAVEATTEDAATEATRPGEQRATVNPFSPIVLAPVEAPAAQVGDVAPVPSNDLQVVEVPSDPGQITVVGEELATGVNEITSEPLVAEGPLPEAVLPAPAVASLPRPLPMATTPVSPDILRNMSRTSVSSDGTVPIDGTQANTDPQLVEISAAVREPGQITPATPATLSASAASVDSGEVELEPVGSMASSASVTESAGANGAPLYAGASPLSTYLRNNAVTFTGYAIGPVSVGIFRSNLSANPVVVTLGQSLPETEFVLTNLQGKEAEFSYGQEKQTLTLDLRR
jgi:hypothetical protein